MGGKAERKYLATHAEPEVALAEQISGEFGHALVIPAYAEGPELLALLREVPPGQLGPVLVVLVLNARSDAPRRAHAANAALRRALEKEANRREVLSGAASLLDHPRGALLLVDRAQPGTWLPRDQGVGLARKIGTDIALALWDAGRLRSAWLHGTDADARLPPDYFARALHLSRTASAAVFPFRHVDEGGGPPSAASLQYEIHLRYTVAGLAWAGSAYAHHAIGSTLASNAGAYARVRGFPRRTAGEDFHLLNKLAKQGDVVQLAGEPIALLDRESERVPFGTARAVTRTRNEIAEGGGHALYDPAVFAHLRAWLSVVERAGGSKESPDWSALIARASAGESDVAPEELCAALEDVAALDAAVRACREETRPAQRRRRLRERFDALQTQRLIHALRARALPSLPLRAALARAPFFDGDPEAPLLELAIALGRDEP